MELDRNLTEERISGLNDNGMTGEFIHEISSLSDTRSVTNEHVLALVGRIEAKRNRREEKQNHQKNRITCHHLNKTKHANIVHAVTLLTSVPFMGRFTGDVASCTTSKQCIRTVRAEETQFMT